MRLQEIYEKYRGDIAFMLIYVREAHPTDKWWLAETKLMRMIGRRFSGRVSFDIKEPTTIEERRNVARVCATTLLPGMPVYVDRMDNLVEQKYVGWPTRVYFIDKEGRVVYNSGIGPFGLKPDVLEKEIVAYLAKTKT